MAVTITLLPQVSSPFVSPLPPCIVSRDFSLLFAPPPTPPRSRPFRPLPSLMSLFSGHATFLPQPLSLLYLVQADLVATTTRLKVVAEGIHRYITTPVREKVNVFGAIGFKGPAKVPKLCKHAKGLVAPLAKLRDTLSKIVTSFNLQVQLDGTASLEGVKVPWSLSVSL